MPVIRRLVLSLLGLWLACGFDAAAAERLRIVTSFLPVYCFTLNVAGTSADVENLLPPGVGPHDYQFSPKDLRKLATADVVVVNGLGVEAWLGRIIEASSGKPKIIVELSAGLKQELIKNTEGLTLGGAGNQDKDEDEHGLHNPHIWLDPRLAEHAVTNILVALQKADPAHAEAYAHNAAQYLERLHKLDAELSAGLASVKDKTFVTFHNAFPYFVRRYGLQQVGVIETVPDVDPSPRYLSELSHIMRTRQTHVIFTEPQFPSKLAEQLARDLKVAIAELDTLETGPFTASAYEEAMRRNLRTLQQQLR